MTDLWIAFVCYSVGALIGLVGMIVNKPGKWQGMFWMLFLFFVVMAIGAGTGLYFRGE